MTYFVQNDIDAPRGPWRVILAVAFVLLTVICGTLAYHIRNRTALFGLRGDQLVVALAFFMILSGLTAWLGWRYAKPPSRSP